MCNYIHVVVGVILSVLCIITDTQFPIHFYTLKSTAFQICSHFSTIQTVRYYKKRLTPAKKNKSSKNIQLTCIAVNQLYDYCHA